MSHRWKNVESKLLLSVCFTLFLIAFRIVYWKEVIFLFYVWNLILAVIPVIISRSLIRFDKLNYKVLPILVAWLLFLPNAPYVITDIFHFFERPPVPKWFDLLLVTSAAWNGLMLGIVSLLQVEEFLSKHVSALKVNVIMMASIAACAFGIYLGRFSRFNSWDIITNPSKLTKHIGKTILFPQDSIRTWAFTLLFGTMLWLVYSTLKKLHEQRLLK